MTTQASADRPRPVRVATQATCPICARDDASSWLAQVDGYEIWRCTACRTDFVFPPPPAAELTSYYDRAAYFEGGERGGYESYDRQTEWSVALFDRLLDELGDQRGRSVLDVGCGYGSHLARALRRGWTCFGVEVSAHARRVAAERHGHHLHLFDAIEHLVPHQFDLVVFFDLLEHLSDPRQALYALFSKGAISPATKVVVTTPNAASRAALADPAGWQFRHPPAHLSFFSRLSLQTLFSRLRFTHIEIEGLHPSGGGSPDVTPHGEWNAADDALLDFDGLLCRASGSDFTEFMHERYVPGTWSKLTEYEHLPRYQLAADLVAGKDVLDFGCGTGYGAAILVQVARSVTALDIDAPAIAWAGRAHHAPSLRFVQRDDLGAGLPAASFDAITCFEMIEHVAQAVQTRLIEQLARLLRPGGIALLSTPNPEVTALYGPNPYHLHEMTRDEFVSLLRAHFRYVRAMALSIHPSITIEAEDAEGSRVRRLALHGASERPSPAVFLALCSQEPLPALDDRLYLDYSVDFVRHEIAAAQRVNELLMRTYTLEEEAAMLTDGTLQLADDLQEAYRRSEELLALRPAPDGNGQGCERRLREPSRLASHALAALRWIRAAMRRRSMRAPRDR